MFVDFVLVINIAEISSCKLEIKQQSINQSSVFLSRFNITDQNGQAQLAYIRHMEARCI
jgi:hypothetical protein